MVNRAANNDNEDDEFGITFPFVSDDDEPKPKGWKATDVLQKNRDDREMRDHLCTSLCNDGMPRLLTYRMRHNTMGSIYLVQSKTVCIAK